MPHQPIVIIPYAPSPLNLIPSCRMIRRPSHPAAGIVPALVAALPQLMSLDLSLPNACLSDGQLGHLTSLSQLRSLTLSSTALEILTNECCSSISQLTQLTQLEINLADGFQSLDILPPLSNLRDLSLIADGTGLEAISCLTRLTRFQTGYGVLEEKVWEALADLKGLKHLDIMFVRLTEAALSTLARLSALTYLYVRCLPEVREPALHLAQPPQLRALHTLELKLGARLSQLGYMLRAAPNLRALRPLHMRAEPGAAKLQLLRQICVRFAQQQGAVGNASEGASEDDPGMACVELGHYLMADASDESYAKVISALEPFNTMAEPSLDLATLALVPLFPQAAIKALAQHLPRLVRLNLSSFKLPDVASLGLVARLQHLLDLQMRDLPKPTDQSILTIADHLGHQLTRLMIGVPTGGLGLPLLVNSTDQAPSFPALRELHWAQDTGDANPPVSEDAHPNVWDLHYLLHSAPRLQCIKPFPRTMMIRYTGDHSPEQQVQAFSGVLRRLWYAEQKYMSLAFLDSQSGSMAAEYISSAAQMASSSGTKALETLTILGFPASNTCLDANLAQTIIEGLPQLSMIQLKCKVEGLPALLALKHLPALQGLKLWACQGLGPADVLALAQAAPHLKLHVFRSEWWGAEHQEQLEQLQQQGRAEGV